MYSIKINKNLGVVTVKAKLASEEQVGKKRITNSDVARYLRNEKKLVVGQLVTGKPLDNVRGNAVGEWVFKLDKPDKAVVKSDNESYNAKPRRKKNIQKKEE